jgi:fibronectin-binding autotransporter adhesin
MTIPPPGPLAYQGQVVVPFINRTFAPSSSNNEFSVPTVWVDTAHSDAYMLVSKPLGIANWLNLGTGGPVSSITITGNSGGSVSPDVGGNFNFLGSGNITIVGTPLTNTLTASLTGTTNHAVQVGNSSGSLTSIGLGTTNTVLLGQTGADPAFGLVPNAALQNSTIDVIAGAGITVVGSPVALGNSVTISATTVTPTTFTEDSGSASPAANNLNILGTSAQGISTSGSGSTVTITAANATSTTKGVASFNGTEFTVTSGAVTSNAMTVTAGTGLTGGGSLNLGGSTSIALTVPVTVPHGGTGLTSTPTNGQLLIGNTGTAGYNLSALTSTGGSVGDY